MRPIITCSQKRVICQYLRKLMMFMPCEYEILPMTISPRGALDVGIRIYLYLFLRIKRMATLQMSINIGIEKLIIVYL